MSETVTLRDRLRALPVVPELGLPGFDPDAVPATPHELFLTWLDDAVTAQALAPHAMVLSTAAADGKVHARTLLLKNVSTAGWWFATQASGPKGRDLEANPHAAATFFWPALGRQVKVTGTAAPATPEASDADFLARSDPSRAACLVGRESEPLASLAEYRAAFAEALDAVTTDPQLTAPDWTAYILTPTTVEFWQAATDGPQVRLLYREAAAAWTTTLLYP